MSVRENGALTGSSEINGYYDRLGRKLDVLSFYGAPAVDDLTAHPAFETSFNVFEFGCGTGRFAARLFEKSLPQDAHYLGCDASKVMLGLAQASM